MRIFKYTGQFRKDLKRYKHNTKMLDDLEKVLKQLKDTGKVDVKHLPHALTGNYRGYMECHIQSDFLLIWIDETEQLIKLVRLGSHSELFSK